MQLHTEVQDGQIIVTLPLSKEEFFAIAWDAANDKARELGWIV